MQINSKSIFTYVQLHFLGGYSFESSDIESKMGKNKGKAAYSNDPNVVATDEEEAAIAKGSTFFGD